MNNVSKTKSGIFIDDILKPKGHNIFKVKTIKKLKNDTFTLEGEELVSKSIVSYPESICEKFVLFDTGDLLRCSQNPPFRVKKVNVNSEDNISIEGEELDTKKNVVYEQKECRLYLRNSPQIPQINNVFTMNIPNNRHKMNLKDIDMKTKKSKPTYINYTISEIELLKNSFKHTNNLHINENEKFKQMYDIHKYFIQVIKNLNKELFYTDLQRKWLEYSFTLEDILNFNDDSIKIIKDLSKNIDDIYEKNNIDDFLKTVDSIRQKLNLNNIFLFSEYHKYLMKKGLSYSGNLFPKDLSSEKHLQVIHNFIFNNLIPKLEELNKSTEIIFVKGGIRNPPIYDLFSISSTAVHVKRNSPKTTAATPSLNLFEAFRDLFKDQSKDNDTISHIYDSIVLNKDDFDAKYEEKIEDGTMEKDELSNFFLDNVSADFKNDNSEDFTKLKELVKSRVKFRPSPSNSISKEDELRIILNVPKEISPKARSALDPLDPKTFGPGLLGNPKVQAPWIGTDPKTFGPGLLGNPKGSSPLQRSFTHKNASTVQAPIQTTIGPGLRSEIFIPAGTVMINLDGTYTKLNMDYILGSVPIQRPSVFGTTSFGNLGPSVFGTTSLGLPKDVVPKTEGPRLPDNPKTTFFYYPELVKDSPTYIPAVYGTAAAGTAIAGDYAAYGTPGYHYVWSSPVSNSDLYYTYNPGGAVRGEFGWSPGMF